MKCKNCGGEIPPNAKECPFCSTTTDDSMKLVLSVKRPWIIGTAAFSAILCCLPTGIIAACLAFYGDNLAERGEDIKAERAYTNAKLVNAIGITLGLIMYGFLILISLAEAIPDEYLMY